MKKLICIFLLAMAANAADSLTVYNAETSTITAQPYTFGRVFADGEITHCPVPVVGGSQLDSSHYQSDVKNRWPDGSVRFAIISLVLTISNGGSAQVQSFADVNNGCNNSGFLTQTQMTNFNSGNWGADIELTSTDSNATIIRNAATMLGQSDPGANAQIGTAAWPDCKNDYWLQGPVVTAVVVQDCTATRTNDMGFKDRKTTVLWDNNCNNTTATTCNVADGTDIAAQNPSVGAPVLISIGSEQMNVTAISGTTPATLTVVRAVNGTSAAPHARPAVVTMVNVTSLIYSTANAAAKSLHPMFILYFYPSINSVAVDFCVENANMNPQDQSYSFVLKTGNPLSQVYSLSTVLGKQYTHISGSRWRKRFWSGTAPGHVLIDHNFPYLISTKALPNYDQNVTVSPETVTSYNYCGTTDYQCFNAGDKGDIWGFGLMKWQGGHAYSASNEMAPVQREDLDYLYNMGNDCGTANGLCAKSWYILTGRRGPRDSSLAAEVAGGAGMWNNMGNVPYHIRESRTTTTGYYCPNMADKNARVNVNTCSGAGMVSNPIGRTFSRQAFSGNQWNSSTGILGNQMGPTSTLSSDGIAWVPGLQWWLDYSYIAYLLTGDYYYLDEEYFSAAYGYAALNPSIWTYDGEGIFSFMNPQAEAVRGTAGIVQTTSYAAFIAPDNSPESLYFNNVVNSNLEIMEGVMNLTGTPLTPTVADSSGAAVNTNCANYDYRSANRWNLGHCTVFSQCMTTGSGCSVLTSTLHSPNPGSCSDYEPYSYYNEQQVTAASNANGVVLTVGTTSNLAGGVDVFGATGNWAAGGPYGTGLNGVNQATVLDSTHVKLANVDTSSGANYPQPLTGAVYISSHYWWQQAKTSDIDDPWNNNYFGTVMGNLDLMGFPSHAIAVEMAKGLVEQFEDSSYNPYLIALYQRPIKQSVSQSYTGSCTGSNADANPFLANWAAVKAALGPDLQNVSTFDQINNVSWFYPCSDHDYALVAYAATTFASFYNPTGNCSGTRPGETCTGNSAWTWATNHIPYFSNAVTGSSSCATSVDLQAKWALAPRVATGCTAPSLTASSLPGATLGTPYSFNFTATGSAPLSWSATGLPAWASLNTSTGLLSGTPNVTGTNTINISVNNSCGSAGPAPFSLTVNAAPAITSASPLPAGTQNNSYTNQMTASGGTLPLVWSVSAGALPAGLSISSGGLINGTPGTAQSSSFTVTLSDANGTSTNSVFTLTINPQINGSRVAGPAVCNGCVLR
ncbi:MAG TPA: Ig domain-containing protein [Bryobacteraceae bacterium]|nr:Ig domain-containing protein [Bryobacteraceae bacterium]